MKRRLAILLLLVLTCLPSVAFAATEPSPVCFVEFTGNRKMRSSRMLQYMHTKVGRPFDEKTLARDIDMFKNWMYFETVTPTVTEQDGCVTITIAVKEKWTVMPEVDVQYGGGAYLVKLGVKDTNFLGYRQEIMGYGGWRAGDWVAGGRFVEPRLAGSIVGFRIEGGRNFYEDPYFLPVKKDVAPEVSFLAERLGGETRLEVEAHEYLRVGVPYRFTVDHLSRVEGSAADQAARLSDWNAPEESDAGALGVWLKTGHVLFDDYIYRGISFETVAYWYDRAFGGDTSFLKMQGDLRFYVPLQWRTNFTGKLFVGYENSDNFIEQYALGGLDTMRGYPDRRYRGQGASYLNLEFRWLAASWWWFSFMFVGLADAGATWNNGVENYYLADNLLTSLGGGLRLIVNKWDYAVIRLDAAWPFATQGPIGITFGMDMFF